MSDNEDLRFKYFSNSHMILDRLSGNTYYCNNKKIVELLNSMNND